MLKIKFDNKGSKYIKTNGGVRVFDENDNDITSGLCDLIIVARPDDVVKAICTYHVSDISGLEGVIEKDHIDVTDIESVAIEKIKR